MAQVVGSGSMIELIDSGLYQKNEDCPSEFVPVVVEVGQWYWVKDTRRVWDDETDTEAEQEYEWLGCVWHVGSNYVEIRQPAKTNEGYSYVRVHFDDFWKELRFEAKAELVINHNIAHYQSLANKHLTEVKAITARLGVTSQSTITNRSAGGEDNALVVMSGQNDIKEYENALILAKDKLLPELFSAIKEANGELTRWMTAGTLPMSAAVKNMKASIGDITDRIFSVSLYAGLTERVVKCREGAPAEFHEKLHVMQRMFYMDEECLMNYRHGGMDYSSIEEFDAWLSEDTNLDRVLPFPKCLIAMRVRRNVKEREWDGSLMHMFIKMHLEKADKLTFLYIRNGDQLYRLSCEMDFGETLFPDKSVYDPRVPIMVKMFGESVDKIITRDDYDERKIKENKRLELEKKWSLENPKLQWESDNPGQSWDWANPYTYHRHEQFNVHDWAPFDQGNVYYDEIALHIAEKIKEHNRIALIIQGLFDRSEVLHPHPPVKIWSPDGFASAIELIYDAGIALADGESPDFDEYIQRCNESLGPDSIVIGQEDYWLTKEAEKENRRRDNDYRDKSKYRPKKYKPEGNDGPGFLAKMSAWKPRSRMATFTWHRERLTEKYWSGKYRGDNILTSLSVPADKLFNVSAYRPGDYLQFYRDSRTRAAYLKWAPMLLAAEEYYAGNTRITGEVQFPV
ncbi:hypothetical protein [Flavobacterium sp.]|uniref:hypothetical protein n=1 Tax=Flavobacterium sp. TaxID=239 RepID=UPI00261E07E9|nr:hypothetical protein [Flavobacterium sp.]